MTEYNPAPSPSGHPLLSGPPTSNDIHQIFTGSTRATGQHHSMGGWVTPQQPSKEKTSGPARYFWLLYIVAHQPPRRSAPRSMTQGTGQPLAAATTLGYDRSRIPAMASSQGDVRSSPMAYPAVRPLPKLPLPVRPDTRTTPQFNYMSGQNVTEHNPAPSPSGHPLLSGPPT